MKKKVSALETTKDLLKIWTVCITHFTNTELMNFDHSIFGQPPLTLILSTYFEITNSLALGKNVFA